MNLAAYLKRIAYEGELSPTVETLFALHKAHLHAIPYENLDIHLGCKLSLDTQTIFNKLVYKKRGGWCYEMNSLFAWALQELGFNVTLLGGAVGREKRGEITQLNHLLLLIKLERSYLADVGFGDGSLYPLPLEEGSYQEDFRTFQLEKLNDEVWRFHNYKDGSAKNFDFTLKPRKIIDFEAQCHRLQTSPESGFVKLNVCQIITQQDVTSLKGIVLKHVTQKGVTESTLVTQEAFEEELKKTFHLELDNSSELWQQAWEKHQQWLRTSS